MEMVTKAHELCAAVKTIKIYKAGRPVGRGDGEAASTTSVRASVWHIKRQYLLWLHLQMEHYENKQIFINDKYKGCSSSSRSREGGREERQMELEQPHKRMPLLTMCVCVCVRACVCSYLCVCLRKIFNLNDVSGNGRGGAAIGACKLSQQHRQPG